MCQKAAYNVGWWFDNSAKTKKRHDLPRRYSVKKVQSSRSEKKKTLLFRKSREKSGNDEAVLQSQVIYRKRIWGKNGSRRMVAPFEPEVDNFANVITVENEAKEDLKITLGLPMEIEKILQHPTE